MQDSTHILQEQVLQAIADKQPLIICGGGSKRFYGRQCEGGRLSTLIHSGITFYEPTELVLTARAGTPLEEIIAVLDSHQQMLACDPPLFSAETTFGGMIAAGLSGPSRPYWGAVQDMILGCTVLNGRGEVLHFGGKVMKNVAGYDISRLMAGSLGCLGVLLDITVKVVPAPASHYTCVFPSPGSKSVELVNSLYCQGYPVSAATCSDDDLRVRFSAGEQEIQSVPAMLDKQYGFMEKVPLEDSAYWTRLRDQQLDFFQDDNPLWRVSCPADRPLDGLLNKDEPVLTEWGGALHWIKTSRNPPEIFNLAESLNGHASCFRRSRGQGDGQVFQPLPAQNMQWHSRLKAAFDPHKLFNNGRMYAEI